jgi:hypothetical protein
LFWGVAYKSAAPEDLSELSSRPVNEPEGDPDSTPSADTLRRRIDSHATVVIDTKRKEMYVSPILERLRSVYSDRTATVIVVQLHRLAQMEHILGDTLSEDTITDPDVDVVVRFDDGVFAILQAESNVGRYMELIPTPAQLETERVEAAKQAEVQRKAAETQAEQDRVGAEAQAKREAAEAARLKRLALEQKKKDAARDARIAKYRAERESAVAEHGAGTTGGGDYGVFTRQFGPPDSDDSTQYDKPRPPLVTRWIEYEPEHVRIVFVPISRVGEPPPYVGWKVFGFVDTRAESTLTRDEAERRLQGRIKARK